MNRLYHRSWYYHDYNTDGTDIFAEEWDTLVIVDACRYDLFERRHRLPGRLESRQSRGSHTREFLVGNVSDRSLHDTVYMSASPQYHRWRDLLGADVHRVVDVWLEDGWDPEYKTVLPETTTSFALDAAAHYPRKRLVVHYLQPHYPFIEAASIVNPRRFGDGDRAPDIWSLLNRGEASVDPAAVVRAYVQNFDRVLPAVSDLLSSLDGRTVVTSDHGNVLAERVRPLPIREWGHPPGLYVEELVRVPWLVYEAGPRRPITPDEAEDVSSSAEETFVRDRLSDLGYVTMGSLPSRRS